MADFPGIEDNTPYQGGFAYQADDAIAGINSVLGDKDLDVDLASMPALTQGQLGWSAGSTAWSVLFRRFRYAAARVTDPELLTSGWFGVNPIPALTTNPVQLSWAPKPQVNPTYVQVNPDGTLNPNRVFGDTEDLYIVGPTNLVVNGGRTVSVTGGRRVRFIGGEYVNALDGPSGTVLRFRNQTDQVFIEGVVIDKQGSKGDGLVWSLKPACDLIVQNCYIGGIFGDASIHGDIMQNQGPVRHVMIDKFSGDSAAQGIFIPGRVQQDGVAWGIGKGYLRRINLRLTHENTPATWHLLYLRDGCASDPNAIKWPVTLEQVWLNPLTKAFSGAFRPNGSSGACGATIDTDPGLGVDRAIWPGGEEITGQANKGTPAGGDFAPRSSIGRGYVSPGYLGHPYVT